MLIEKLPYLKGGLNGKTIVLTGGGGGIGLEAEKAINELFNSPLVEFYEIDLSNEASVAEMCDYIQNKYGCPNVIFNNATMVKLGAIEKVDSVFWNKSYEINLRAPLLLAQRFINSMKKQNNGVIIFVPSSGASPYMGAYEVFKTAQVELCNTLSMELENTNVHAFTIGPGLVKTETAMNAIKTVATDMGMSTEEFYAMNKSHILDAESAGVGFALSVLRAEKYHGQEIGSIQVLLDYDLIQTDSVIEDDTVNLKMKKEIIPKILSTFKEQYQGWRNMNLFERQWVFRDFKKSMGMSAEQAFDKLQSINERIKQDDFSLNQGGISFFENLKNIGKDS